MGVKKVKPTKEVLEYKGHINYADISDDYRIMGNSLGTEELYNNFTLVKKHARGTCMFGSEYKIIIVPTEDREILPDDDISLLGRKFTVIKIDGATAGQSEDGPYVAFTMRNSESSGAVYVEEMAFTIIVSVQDDIIKKLAIGDEVYLKVNVEPRRKDYTE